MSEKTGIEWTDHTFNPWWGCTKVSEACRSCYAEEWAGRFPKTQGLWGPDAPRKIASEKVWHDPIRWFNKAVKDGVRRRVFCASMADVFEDRRDLDEARARLFGLIWETQGATPESPGLDWQLLTKRPERVRTLLLRAWAAGCSRRHNMIPLKVWADGGEPFRNVWLGCTVENQEEAEKRIPHLLEMPVRVRFLSCEPLLGLVKLGPFAMPEIPGGWLDPLAGYYGVPGLWREPAARISWVIAGGESGHDPRPMHPEWARSLRDQCAAAGVPFFFKQWGEFAPMADDAAQMWRVGKKAAGSLLDGVSHKAFPVSS